VKELLYYVLGYIHLFDSVGTLILLNTLRLSLLKVIMRVVFN